jgi:hypothetical protein
VIRGLMATLLAFLATGCARRERVELWLAVDRGPDSGIELAEISVKPRAALVERRREGARLLLGLAGERRVVVEAPFACPLEIDLAEGAAKLRRLVPLFSVGASRRVVGFENAFEIRAEPACAAANDARIELAVAGGAELATHTISPDGRTLSGRTGPVPPLAPHLERGVVPVGAGDRHTTKIHARTRLRDGRERTREIEIAAGTRASGLANVALHHHVLLRGDRLELVERPAGSAASLRRLSSLFELVPDVPGRFVIGDATAGRLVVESGRFDEMPLDCGRADCHREIADSAQKSPMTHALANDFASRRLSDPSCALACHTTGEAGRDDGGFHHVLHELGEPSFHSFAELPRALRRLGGVGCLACHGPTAIPEIASRFAVLGSGVCAVCHDAPPRYGHVRAFASTRMASADRDPSTREGACARCHTTFGALGRETHRPPAGTTLGIACAACHDVHPHGASDSATSPSPPVLPRLIRQVAAPAVFGELPSGLRGSSRVCLACHAPSADGSVPEASAAALLAGRGGVRPADAVPLAGTAPHAEDARGCLSCHATGPEGFGRGASHAFAVDGAACSSCHAERPRDPALAARARKLHEKLAGTKILAEKPPHAHPRARPRDPVLARALDNVALVLEDPAADVHNPRYATLLLDAAETVLAPRSRGAITTDAP